jgi:hypothetical protein
MYITVYEILSKFYLNTPDVDFAHKTDVLKQFYTHR